MHYECIAKGPKRDYRTDMVSIQEIFRASLVDITQEEFHNHIIELRVSRLVDDIKVRVRAQSPDAGFFSFEGELLAIEPLVEHLKKNGWTVEGSSRFSSGQLAPSLFPEEGTQE